MTPTRQVSITSLLLLGLVLGLAGGLYYAWIVDPIVFVNAGPARFSGEYQAEYIYLVSQNYVATGDVNQAEQRLAALEDSNLEQTIIDLLEASLREQRSPETVQALAQMAQALGIDSPTVALFVPDGEERPLTQLDVTPTSSVLAPPTPTSLPTPTIQPNNTPTPTIPPTRTQPPLPTTAPTYRLLTQQPSCEQGNPLIEIITLDTFLEDLPGVGVSVRWDGGTDRFFTGFKPNERAGYGDFSMEEDVVYAVSLLDGSPEVSNLRAEVCDNGRLGGWELTFQNLILPRATPES
ncbi:MAG: hypothetical protein AAF614_04005 [Chloroflexota bacterium]